MPAPISYAVDYDFSGFQALNPATPLPGAALDAELAGVQASLVSVIAALADVRRSDGGVQNGVVSFDSCDAQLQALLGGGAKVTAAQLDPAAFATQSDAESAVATDKISSPLRVKQALDALRALASQAEAQTGTDNTKMMTPLRVVEALDALRAFASQAEAQAGTNNTKVMTPLRAAEALAALRPAFTASAALTFGEIAATASATATITVTGAVAGDRVVLGLPAAGVTAGIVLTAWVSAADTVTVRATNITGGALTPTAGMTVSATALRF